MMEIAVNFMHNGLLQHAMLRQVVYREGAEVYHLLMEGCFIGRLSRNPDKRWKFISNHDLPDLLAILQVIVDN